MVLLYLNLCLEGFLSKHSIIVQKLEVKVIREEKGLESNLSVKHLKQR